MRSLSHAASIFTRPRSTNQSNATLGPHVRHVFGKRVHGGDILGAMGELLAGARARFYLQLPTPTSESVDRTEEREEIAHSLAARLHISEC